MNLTYDRMIVCKLKKDFDVNNGLGEIYKKGSLVAVPEKHSKHNGFCCNVAFINKKRQIKSNKTGMAALFSLDHFIPRKAWFEPV